MNIEQASNISLVEFLAWLGHHPVKIYGKKYWYNSPYRNENTPSFKVNMAINQWYDFGVGEGGGIILLVKRIFHTDDTAEALRKIQERAGVSVNRHNKPPCQTKSEESVWTNVMSLPLSSKSLFDYITERGISIAIAERYCREISYSMRGKRYFSIGFLNNSGGYEIRNKYFKGCMGKKDISAFQSEAKPELETSCARIFEGFFDFLSYLTLIELGVWKSKSYGQEDFIVLNSVSTVKKLKGKIDGYDRVYTYLDNDDAGKTATKFITEETGNNVCDVAILYKIHKDLNEYLCAYLKNNDGVSIYSEGQ